MRASRRIASTLATLATVAAIAVPSVPAAAAASSGHCTAYGSLPKHLSMHSDHVAVRVVLRGSAACHGERADNGATAYLHRPGSPKEELRWRKFGSSQRVVLYVNLDRAGTYSLNAGDVQVFDSTYRHVASSWRPTTMIVKHAARITGASASASTVSGRVQAYSKFGWTADRGVTVSVQRRAAGSSTWHMLGSTRADAQGRISFRTATSANHLYRLTTRSTASVWSARSKAVRG
jgi:hypothetical protein